MRTYKIGRGRGTRRVKAMQLPEALGVFHVMLAQGLPERVALPEGDPRGEWALGIKLHDGTVVGPGDWLVFRRGDYAEGMTDEQFRAEARLDEGSEE